MTAYLALLYAQSDFVLVFCAVISAGIAYSLASIQSNWLLGLVLFPGLYFGSLATVQLGTDIGVIAGRDKDMSIIMVAFVGAFFGLVVYYLLFLALRSLNSFSRRAHRELLERAGDKRL